MAENTVRSEEVLGQKWDRCLADTSLKFFTGLAVGGVFSLIFFKRKAWPVVFGSGVGLGMGYANCQHDFQSPFVEYGRLLKEKQDESSS